jgi:hypothetical protein
MDARRVLSHINVLVQPEMEKQRSPLDEVLSVSYLSFSNANTFRFP